MSTPAKLAALRNRTIANGCTPGEVEAAKAALERMQAAHPHLFAREASIREMADDFFRKQARPSKPTIGQVFANAVQAAPGKPTKQVFAAAAACKVHGYDRKTFMEYALAGGYNKNTAGTQWAAAHRS